MPVAFQRHEEGLGRAKLQEQVQPDGDVVLVVGDEEAHNLLVFSVFPLQIGEFQTTVFLAIVSLDDRLSAELQLTFLTVIAIDDGEVDDMSLLPVDGIEGTSTEEDAQHVVDTVVISVLLPRTGTVDTLEVLLDVSLASGIAVENLVNGIALALLGTLTEIERSHVGSGVAKQRVAQHEHVVGPAVATCGQRSTIGVLTLIDTVHGIHRSIAGFHPYELPVEIEVISQELTTVESRVTESTLSRYRCRCRQ